MDSSFQEKTDTDEGLAPIYGALDLGTSNCRLLIAQSEKNGIKEIERYSRVVRLGEGLRENGYLSQQAMDRTIEALKECTERCDEYQLKGFRAVATEACRLAGNGAEFVERAAKEARVRLDIITHEQEAIYAFAGCSPFIEQQESNVLLIDIGGGSTELVWAITRKGKLPEVKGWTTIPCGVVLLSELQGEEYFPRKNYVKMLDKVDAELQRVKEDFFPKNELEQRPLQVICTSGTVTSVAALHLGLAKYDRRVVDGMLLHVDQVEEVRQKLLKMSYPSMLRHKCIGRDRADFMLPGCSILDVFSKNWPIESIRVTDRGVRDGIIYALMAVNN